MVATYGDDMKVIELEELLVHSSNFRLRLYSNDLTPVDATPFANFTECVFSGYAPATPTWGPVILNGDGNAESTALLEIFAHDGGPTPDNVYGWYLTWEYAAGVHTVMHAERLVGPSGPPISMSALGNEIYITPRLLRGSCPLVP